MTARQPGHRTRTTYDGFVDALEDADHVLADLQALGADQLLIASAEVDFTARRARQLVRAAILEAQREGVL